jgi:hypothetical protein
MHNKLRVGLVASVAAAGLIPLAVSGLANAATVNSSSSTIPKSVFKSERLSAEAQVLNTTTANVQAAMKNKTLKQLKTGAGLTGSDFSQKLKAQLITDLEAKGYTPAAITNALGHHKHIGHVKAHKENVTKKDKS